MTDIVSATFQEDGATVLVVTDDGHKHSVPTNSPGAWPDRLQEWLDEGNTIAPYVPPTPPTAAELAALYAQQNAELVGIVGFFVSQIFEMQNRLSVLDGGNQFPVSVAGAQQWLDYVEALPSLPDSKIEKLIEIVS